MTALLPPIIFLLRACLLLSKGGLGTRSWRAMQTARTGLALTGSGKRRYHQPYTLPLALRPLTLLGFWLLLAAC